MEIATILLVTLAGLFLVGGGYLLFHTVLSIAGSVTRKEVVSVVGEIVDLAEGSDSDGSKAPAVKYEFEHEGKSFKSNRIFKYGDVFWGSFGTQTLQKHARIHGKQIEVFYFKGCPKNSWIWIEKDWLGILKSIVAGVLVICVGGSLLTFVASMTKT